MEVYGRKHVWEIIYNHILETRHFLTIHQIDQKLKGHTKNDK